MGEDMHDQRQRARPYAPCAFLENAEISVAELYSDGEIRLSILMGISTQALPSSCSATERLIAAARKAGVPRLVVVGGCGSLNLSPGVTVLDSGFWPAPYVLIAKSHVKAFAALKASDINWTYFSPPMMIQPGERTGKFRLGGDDLIKDAEGKSRVSFEDYAVALADELEKPKYVRSRFTIGY